MRNLLLTIFILLFFRGLSFSQDWFSEHDKNEKVRGFVIGIAGDTIHGFIQYDYPIIMQKKVLFYEKVHAPNPVTYTPEDIRGYHCNQKQWESIQVMMDTYNGPYTFNRFGILSSEPGPVALYRIFQEKDKIKKRINSKEAELLIEDISLYQEEGSLDNIYIKKLAGPAEPVFTQDFRKSFVTKMETYVGDYQKLLNKIRKKELKMKDVKSIISEYNHWFTTNLMK